MDSSIQEQINLLGKINGVLPANPDKADYSPEELRTNPALAEIDGIENFTYYIKVANFEKYYLIGQIVVDNVSYSCGDTLSMDIGNGNTITTKAYYVEAEKGELYVSLPLLIDFAINNLYNNNASDNLTIVNNVSRASLREKASIYSRACSASLAKNHKF